MSSNILIATPFTKTNSIVSRKTFVAKSGYDKPSGLGTFLAQGIAGPALGALFFISYTQIFYPELRPYPVYLFNFSFVFGIPFGLLTSLLVWAMAKDYEGLSSVPIRIFLGVAISGIFHCWPLLFVYANNFTKGFLPLLLASSLMHQVGIALSVGSRFRPVRTLTQGFPGTEIAQWHTKLIGFLVRGWVLIGVVESILIARLLYNARASDIEVEFQLSVLAAAHFAVAFVATFINFPLWLTTFLILIANTPIGYFLHRGIEHSTVRYVAIVYLALWPVFLLSRMKTLRAKISFLKEEFKYYLVD